VRPLRIGPPSTPPGRSAPVVPQLPRLILHPQLRRNEDGSPLRHSGAPDGNRLSGPERYSPILQVKERPHVDDHPAFTVIGLHLEVNASVLRAASAGHCIDGGDDALYGIYPGRVVHARSLLGLRTGHEAEDAGEQEQPGTQMKTRYHHGAKWAFSWENEGPGQKGEAP